MILKSNRWNNQVLLNIQLTKSQDIFLIYKNSKEAFSFWKNIHISQRLLYISNFLNIYKTKRNEIANSITIEIGKPITQALADVDYDIWYIERFVDNAKKILADEVICDSNKNKHIIKYDPIWVMAVISPRNYPTSQRVRQIIPTLIAGNTVIYKCSSSCMRTANILNQILKSVLPKDVFSEIYGDSKLGDKLIKWNCDAIIFTGSTKIWLHIAKIAAIHIKKTFLELGWSAPAVICKDAMIDDNMMHSFDYYRRRHGWQICDGIKRLIIHRDKFDEFMIKMSKHLNNKKIWNPLDPKTDIWPLISQNQKDILLSQIQDAKDKWAKIIQLGKYDNTPWAFVLPTLITDVSLDMQIMTEETFGPILPIYIYDNISEAINIANSTIYGLGGYIWSDNSDDIDKLIIWLNTWNISINNAAYLLPEVPFWWYTVNSGNTRAHGKIWLRELCKIKTISLSN